MPNRVRPFVVLAGEGHVVRAPGGGLVTFKARAETTNGTFTALEVMMAPGDGPPLHVHTPEDEMFYVLEGELRFKAGDRVFDAPAGSFVFIPRGTPHCPLNAEDAPAKVLGMFTPAGMERFFDEGGKLPHGAVDPATLRAIAHDASMEIVGPPLAHTDHP